LDDVISHGSPPPQDSHYVFRLRQDSFALRLPTQNPSSRDSNAGLARTWRSVFTDPPIHNLPPILVGRPCNSPGAPFPGGLAGPLPFSPPAPLACSSLTTFYFFPFSPSPHTRCLDTAGVPPFLSAYPPPSLPTSCCCEKVFAVLTEQNEVFLFCSLRFDRLLSFPSLLPSFGFCTSIVLRMFPLLSLPCTLFLAGVSFGRVIGVTWPPSVSFEFDQRFSVPTSSDGNFCRAWVFFTLNLFDAFVFIESSVCIAHWVGVYCLYCSYISSRWSLRLLVIALFGRPHPFLFCFGLKFFLLPPRGPAVLLEDLFFLPNFTFHRFMALLLVIWWFSGPRFVFMVTPTVTPSAV